MSPTAELTSIVPPTQSLLQFPQAMELENMQTILSNTDQDNHFEETISPVVYMYVQNGNNGEPFEDESHKPPPPSTSAEAGAKIGHHGKAATDETHRCRVILL